MLKPEDFYDVNNKPIDLVTFQAAEKIILDASSTKETCGPVPIQTATATTLARIKEQRSGEHKDTGFMTNFPDLDRIIHPGTLNIIAARMLGQCHIAIEYSMPAVQDASSGLVADCDGLPSTDEIRPSQRQSSDRSG